MLSSYLHDHLIEAGCDEVGRGCLSGPVVAAAVILPKDYHHPLMNDSKKLRKNTRKSLENEIKNAAISWAIAEVSPQEIDRINILQASFLAMHRAIDQLTIKPEHLLIDGNRFKAYRDIPHTCVIKGDGKYLNIAAASILAKIYRDELMEKLAGEYPHYDWENNAGYPTAKHRNGIEIHGATPHHRMSFKLLPDQLDLFDSI